MEALISVVVPVYNVEKYLNRCLQSIVNQTYQNLEIILVDDGSTDNCPEMCDSWAGRDNRIKVIHKENAGLGMARNTGIENATGKYICFLDSDDYIEPGILEKAYLLSEKTHSQITVFGLSKVDADGKIIRQIIPQAEKTVLSGEEIRREFLPDLINGSVKNVKYRNLSLSLCVCLISMELINRTQWTIASERAIISEDSYSLLQLYRYVEKAAILCESGYFYCLNEASLTQVYRADRFEKTKQFYYKAIELQETLGYSEEIKNRLARLFLAFSISALKQVVACGKNGKEKMAELSRIVTDETMQEILRGMDIRCYNIKLRLMFTAMRFRMVRLVYLMAWLQLVLEKCFRRSV